MGVLTWLLIVRSTCDRAVFFTSMETCSPLPVCASRGSRARSNNSNSKDAVLRLMNDIMLRVCLCEMILVQQAQRRQNIFQLRPVPEAGRNGIFLHSRVLERDV